MMMPVMILMIVVVMFLMLKLKRLWKKLKKLSSRLPSGVDTVDADYAFDGGGGSCGNEFDAHPDSDRRAKDYWNITDIDERDKKFLLRIEDNYCP